MVRDGLSLPDALGVGVTWRRVGVRVEVGVAVARWVLERVPGSEKDGVMAVVLVQVCVAVGDRPAVSETVKRGVSVAGRLAVCELKVREAMEGVGETSQVGVLRLRVSALVKLPLEVGCAVSVLL